MFHTKKQLLFLIALSNFLFFIQIKINQYKHFTHTKTCVETCCIFAVLTTLKAGPPRGGKLGQFAPAREGPPNYIASLLCRESVDGSQEAVGRGPPDNFRTNMVFLYITNEDQIRFEPRHAHYMYISFTSLPKFALSFHM